MGSARLAEAVEAAAVAEAADTAVLRAEEAVAAEAAAVDPLLYR